MNLNPYIHPTQKTEAQFRRAYPWRQCDRSVFRKFCEWKGRKFGKVLASGMTPFEAGRAYVFNCEKTELDLEKLQFDWDDFQEEEARAAQNKAARQRIKTQADDAETQERDSIRLGTLKRIWAEGRHSEVQAQIAQHPEWGIMLGPEGPEVNQ